MTVEEMRAIMRRRVVPENLVVQNIVEYLMDDSAQLPQLNAFTFLSRLQQLGMASADFVVLLEGCGVPQDLVDKIKANPAMNLNNLVLTFENSGLTSEDYSRILYTARLVWEQTQTSGGTVVPFTNENRYQQNAKSYQGKTVSELFDDEPEESDDTSNDYDDEPTFEEIIRHIHSTNFADVPEKMPEETAVEEPTNEETAHSEEASSEEDDANDAVYEAKAEDEPIEAAFEEAREKTDIENIEEDMSEDDVSETEQNEAQTPEDTPEENARPVNLDDTSTLIISIDQEQLKNEIKQSSEESEKADELSENTAEDKPDAEDEKIDEENSDKDGGSEEANIPNEKTDYSYDNISDDENGDDESADDESNEDSRKDEDHSDEEPDDDNYSEENEYENTEKLRASGYNKPALITSAAGAFVLLLICAFFTFFLKIDGTKKNLVYAKNAEEIFTEVYDSYTAGNMGGENAQEYFKGERLFGTILVSEDDFGMFSDGKIVYTAFANKITAHDELDVNTGSQRDILPPENTRFVEIWESKSSIIAVFSGTECGFMRIEKGEVTFTVRQDGGLCDFAVEENEISFGSVYVPHYTRNFTAADTDEYLPRLGKNEKAVISAENIVLGNVSGCSFAVWGKYSLSDGSTVLARAAIGDPVYSGAYGVCAMNYTDKDGGVFGRIIRFSDEPSQEPSEENSKEQEENASNRLFIVQTDKISAAADGKNAFALIDGNIVKIFNEELEAKSGLENLSQIPVGMRFDGDVLLLNGENGIFRAVDCSDTDAPAAIEAKKANGAVSKDSAVLFEKDSAGGSLKATLMKIENGEAKQIGVYSIKLSQSEMDSLELGGANTIAVSGESCAFSYKYFDGVSVISVCALFGEKSSEMSLFDDKTGFNAVFTHNGKIIAVSSRGAEIVFE
ncbi:MAG: hypothetical protein J1F03_02010 [Oscillospiraceae bacterium]|nr:hypothetical protein [Oscillospiraceae bacterium]